MSGIFTKRIGSNTVSTAIIGGSSTGSVLAAFLSALGIGPITIIEANEKLFDDKCSTLNAVGLVHHLLYGAKPDYMRYLFHSGILLRELLPERVFSGNRMNYFVPAKTPDGDINSAINGDIKLSPKEAELNGMQYKIDASISLKSNVTLLQNLYKQYTSETQSRPYGSPEVFCQELSEKDVRELLGALPPKANNGNWLTGENGPDNGFAMGIQIKQSILNPVKYAIHMCQLLEKLKLENKLSIQTNRTVYKIKPKATKFELFVKENTKPFYFDNVVNAGYAAGMGITQPSENHEEYTISLKAFGLFELPPEMVDNFISFSLVRGWFGGVTRAGSNLVSVSSGIRYDRESRLFKLGKDNPSFIKDWSQGGTQVLGATEAQLLLDIKQDMAKWVPFIGTLRPVALRYAPHLYPSSRLGADVISAANRNVFNIYDHCENNSKGQYFRLFASKQTVVIRAAVEAALQILEPFICKGILCKKEIDEHINIAPNGHVKLSKELQTALGKHLPAPPPSFSKSFVDSRSIPSGYL